MGDWTGTVPTILAGDIPTGDDWKNVTDELSAISTAWSTWVPTLTNLTLGNGTQTARYRRVGKTVDWYWRFVLGSTSAVGTDPTFTLPAVQAAHYASGSGDSFFPGIVRLVDSGVTTRQGDFTLSSSQTLRLVSWNATPALAQITSTAPWTWGTGDSMLAWGTYETT